MQPVLTGIKVLDFGHYIAGPYTAMLLADQGADVIKVEPPSGDPGRKTPGFVVWNRGKRSLALDLKHNEGREIAQELARHCNVVIHNFKPGVPERLGIDYDTMSNLNPNLVYCSITGYGESGPYRDEPGWDPLVCSMSNVYMGQGGTRSGKPIYLLLPLPSYFGAMMAAFSITVGLFNRPLIGRGQKVEVPLFNTMIGVQSSDLLDFEGLIRLGQRSQPGGPVLWHAYKAADGQWLFLALGNIRFVIKFAQLVGHEEWLADPRFEGAPLHIFGEDALAVEKILSELIAGKPRDEWLQMLREADIPCAPVLRVEDFMDDPQVAVNEMVVELDDPNVGRVREMGIPVKLSLNHGQIKGPSPMLGQHTEELLAEIGLSPARIAELRERRVIRQAD